MIESTIEEIHQKLKQIENEVAQLRAQLNRWLAQPTQSVQLEQAIQLADKEKLRSLTAKTFEEMGIRSEPIDAEQLQEMVAACGVKAEDNIFSRGIIEMREE